MSTDDGQLAADRALKLKTDRASGDLPEVAAVVEDDPHPGGR
jgi:hypothetical protein